MKSIRLLGLVAASLYLFTTIGNAASIAYGDFGPVSPGVRFRSVIESSVTDPVPLYGPPTPYSVGLDFNPLGFGAVGLGGSSDITDGQLNFGVEGGVSSAQLVGISSIRLFESGDFTLAGLGTAATQDFAGAIMRITVTQIDGVNVAPIALSPANASVGFNLIANPGIVQPWSLGLSLDINSQLTAMGLQFTAGATKLEVVIDNQLIALSETDSVAAILKKDFRIDVTPDIVPVPEPASAALLGIGGVMMAIAGWLNRRGGLRA